jgi:hypothetical protein
VRDTVLFHSLLFLVAITQRFKVRSVRIATTTVAFGLAAYTTGRRPVRSGGAAAFPHVQLMVEVQCVVDEREVREGLRGVAELLAGDPDLLGEWPSGCLLLVGGNYDPDGGQ